MLEITQQSLLPDWQKAKIHAQAVNVARPKLDLKERKVCECCNNVIDREQMKIGTNIKNLSFLGFGIPLYFLVLQYCIILNLLLVVTDGIMMVNEAVKHNKQKCATYYAAHPAGATVASAHPETTTTETHHFLQTRPTHASGGSSAQNQAHKMQILCHNNFVYIANVIEYSSVTETLSRISSFVIQILFLIYVKNSLIKTGQYYNQISVDLSDYSVIFKGLPKKIHDKRKKFDNIISSVRHQGQLLNYFMILVVPEGEQLYHLNDKNEVSMKQFLSLRQYDEEKATQKFLECKRHFNDMEHEVMKHKEELKTDTIQAQNVIIVFQTEDERQIFMKRQNDLIIKAKLAEFFGEQELDEIQMVKCPDPKQIIWHHLKHRSGRNLRIFYGWLLSFIFLFVILVVFYFLSSYKATLLANAGNDASKKTWASVIAWSTLIGIVLFNKFIMGPVLHYFTHIQHHDDKSNDDFSFAFKYAIGMFFTTCLMTIAVQAIMHKNYYSHPFGIIQQESLMFIFSAVLVPLIWFIHPYQLYHQFQRWRYQGTATVTQSEANVLMADYEYSVGKRYAQIIEMMWFAFLYVDLIPAGTFMILIGLCAYYWVDKFNLLRRSSAPHNVSAALSFKINQLIDLTLFWRFAGQILFDLHLKHQIQTVTIVLLILSILFVILPWKTILKVLADEQFQTNDKRISDIYQKYFEEDNYIDKNPTYKELELTKAEKASLIGSYNKKR